MMSRARRHTIERGLKSRAPARARSLSLSPFTHSSMYFSIVWAKVCFGTAPITVSIFFPFLNIITVGMLLMPYSVATAGLSSVLSLTALSFPLYSSASSSTSGAIIRQGPHQGAQKSTRTGRSHFRTFSSQSASVTASACGSALFLAQVLTLKLVLLLLKDTPKAEEGHEDKD